MNRSASKPLIDKLNKTHQHGHIVRMDVMDIVFVYILNFMVCFVLHLMLFTFELDIFLAAQKMTLFGQ